MQFEISSQRSALSTICATFRTEQSDAEC